jgi:ribulose-5-phosphate 4-epimerase/fuculose-1-phosphate aldolase
MMADQADGVIKFQLDYSPGPALPAGALAELNAWRKILFLLQLIGQDPRRYGGYGYGNISRRLKAGSEQFVITGTQTGGLPELEAVHYVTVLACVPPENRLVARGPVKPSAESLTHGAVYAQDSALAWVMHAHSPHLWRHAAALGLPITSPAVAYGTPAMAAEVARLFRETDVRAQGIFAMGGHEDGMVSFGRTAAAAGGALTAGLAQAFQLENF